ncbi:protein nessun dorma-like isoform X2 [Schistocerca nitens]|uniref:protein nessun dorma-like isoform X2 n=1 Tax=Schistocerca nitens TaxID=7011 RepID=UPI0021191B3C|nr:protein nessun dorma-like isoform X2 [Schistocerca nitens]
MASDVYTFEKTLNERLIEYQTILCIDKESLPGPRIRSVWGSYLQLLIEGNGWSAIWKICRKTCEKYSIGFPTVVFVVDPFAGATEQFVDLFEEGWTLLFHWPLVLGVDCTELSAVIEVNAVQDDIHLPLYHRVPLIHLYPTKQQRKNCLKIEETAECLDQLSQSLHQLNCPAVVCKSAYYAPLFFYNHLWRPWDDMNEYCKSDWPATHLQQRIDLLEVMQSDAICREKWEYLRSLLQEAKDIKQNMESLDSELTEDGEVPVEVTYSLTKYYLRLKQIKKEVESFENPVTRKLLTQKQKTAIVNEGASIGDKSTWIVFQGQSVQDINELIVKILNYFPSTTYVNSCSTVQRALESLSKNKVIVLCPGLHKMSNLDIQCCCVLRGFAGHPLSSTLVAEGSCILDYPGSNFALEDLIISCENNTASVIIRSGFLKIRNCHFFGTKWSFNSPAIIVLQGAHVEIDSSVFSNLGTALIICPGAVVHIASSEISSCSVGIQISDDAILVTDGLKIIKSTECAMKIECIKEENREKSSGTTDIVSSFCGIKSNNLAIESTVGDEVIVIHSGDLAPYEEFCV